MSQQRIIDADGHVMELDDELREYIGGPYAELEWHRSYGFWPGLTMDGYLRSLRQPGGWVGGRHRTQRAALARLPRQERHRADRAVPDPGLTHAAIRDHEWAITMARAYNDWLHDRFMRVSPRLVGVALLPIQDIDEAVKELRRSVEELGMVGAVLPSATPGGKLFSGP